MLTLTRKPGQEIIVGDNIRVIVKEIRGQQVRLGFDAPAGVLISRGEMILPAELAGASLEEETEELKPVASAAPRKAPRTVTARPLPPAPGTALPGTGTALPGTGTALTLDNLFRPDSPVGRATAAARDRLSARPPRLSRGARRPPQLL